MGVGRRTRKEIVKWNQMTALRFQMGESSGLPGFPSGTLKKEPSTTLMELSIMH